MPGDSQGRDFDIDRCKTREEVIERLAVHYRLSLRMSYQAAHHPETITRWVHVEGTRKDFSVRYDGGVWKIRIRKGPIPPRPRG